MFRESLKVLLKIIIVSLILSVISIFVVIIDYFEWEKNAMIITTKISFINISINLFIEENGMKYTFILDCVILNDFFYLF